MSEMRRTDAKAYFANERTFLHWLSTAVTLGTIAAALSGVSVMVAVSSTLTFIQRNESLKASSNQGWGRTTMPLIICLVVATLLVGMEVGAVIELKRQL